MSLPGNDIFSRASRRWRWLSSAFNLAVISLILFVAIGAKVPNSHCHCHDKTPVKKESCPFKQLRILASTAIAETPIVLSPPRAAPPSFHFCLVSVPCPELPAEKARDPPRARFLPFA